MRIVDGVDRIEIGWSISDTVIDSPDQLANHETFSRNPWGHTFGHGDRAKKMYYSLRYLTKEGDEQLVGSAGSGCSIEKSPRPFFGKTPQSSMFFHTDYRITPYKVAFNVPKRRYKRKKCRLKDVMRHFLKFYGKTK